MKRFYSILFVCVFACFAVGAYFQWAYLPQIAELNALKNKRHQLLQDYQQTSKTVRDLRVICRLSSEGQLNLKQYKSLYFYSKKNAVRAIKQLFLMKRINIVELEDRTKDPQSLLNPVKYKISFTINPRFLEATVKHLFDSSLPVFLDSMYCQRSNTGDVCQANLITFLEHRDAMK